MKYLPLGEIIMIELHELKDTSMVRKKTKRVGRGVGSKRGKTCTRGTKGAKARSGYKRRVGTEGGQLPMFRKIPIRGFSRGMFKKDIRPNEYNAEYTISSLIELKNIIEV